MAFRDRAERWKLLGLYGLAALAYSAMAILQTWPTIMHMGSRTPANCNSIAPYFSVAEQALLLFRDHPLNLHAAFSPALAFPMESPFLLLGVNLSLAVLSAPFYLATGNLYFSINMCAFLCFTGSALSFFALARYLLQSNRGAFLAGMVFSLTGPNLSMLMDGASLVLIVFPLILLFFFKFLYEDKPKFMFIAMALLALQFYMYFYHCLYAVYFMAVIAVWKRGFFFTREKLLVFYGAGVMGVMLILPLAAPYLKTMAVYRLHEMTNAAESLFSYAFSFSPSEWLNVAPGNWLYGAWLNQDKISPLLAGYPLAALFPGILVWYLILAWAARMPAKRISPLFLAGVLIFTMAASTGLEPLQFFRKEMSVAVVSLHLSNILPLGSILRNPNRLYIFYTLALGLLAGGAFAALENRLAGKSLRKIPCAAIAFALVVCVINMENLSIPLPLESYDEIFGPTQSDAWLAEHNPLKSLGESILHIPAKERMYQFDSGVAAQQLYRECAVGVYRHLLNRHPVANMFTSFVPSGIVSRESRRLPETIAQQYLYAMGVRLIVVHGSLIHGQYREKFSPENLQSHGLELLASFDGGDAVYRLNADICMEDRLFLRPAISGDRLRVDALTPGLIAPAEPQAEATVCFWTDPKVCANQYLWATVADGKGLLHRMRLVCHFPLVVRGWAGLVDYDLKERGLAGPFELVSLEWNEHYLLPAPDAAPLPGNGKEPRTFAGF